MSVYVDNAFIPYGRMLMSHMLADELDELHEMAAKLGLKREWFQNRSIPHYDVCKANRERAISLGAISADVMSDTMKALRREQRRRQRERQQADR